jgi:hypothetical protein
MKSRKYISLENLTPEDKQQIENRKIAKSSTWVGRVSEVTGPNSINR